METNTIFSCQHHNSNPTDHHCICPHPPTSQSQVRQAHYLAPGIIPAIDYFRPPARLPPGMCRWTPGPCCTTARVFDAVMHTYCCVPASNCRHITNLASSAGLPAPRCNAGRRRSGMFLIYHGEHGLTFTFVSFYLSLLCSRPLAF